MIAIVLGIFLAAATYEAFTSPATPGAWAILGVLSVVWGIYIQTKTMKKMGFVGWLGLVLVAVSMFGGLLMFVYGSARL